MVSLYKQIEQLQEEHWNYYAGMLGNRPIPKPFSTENTSANFISQYFKKGGKEEAVKEFKIDSFAAPRADHTVSIFFLGLLIYKRTVLNGKIVFGQQTSALYEFFQFIWFVTCLSHDAAFYQEHDKILYKNCPDLISLKQHLNIEHDLTSLSVPNVPAYMFDLCEHYFSFRHKHSDFKATDHGIYAGILLYDRLVKNRIEKKAASDKDYLWESYLDAEYAYAAATVSVHNIWFPERKDRSLYKRYNLHGLLDKQPIKYADAPLLFLLGLVDTIDPVKAYPCVTPSFVLHNVFLSFPNEDSFELKLSSHLNFDILKKKSDDLEKWLHVSTQVEDRTITVSIKD